MRAGVRPVYATEDVMSEAPPVVRAPRGTELTCKGWLQEAALRMLMNNLDPDVAEAPDRLVDRKSTRLNSSH